MISEHKNEKRKIGSEMTWVAVGQITAALGGLFGVRIITQLLTPASYGELALAMTATILATQVFFGPISQCLSRFFVPAQESGELSVYSKIGYVLIRNSVIALTAMTLFFVIGLVIAEQMMWLVLILLSLFLSIILGVSICSDAIQNAARQRSIVAWHQGAGQWLRFALAAGLIYTWGANSSIAVIGYMMAALIILGSQIIFLKKRISPLIGVGEIECQSSAEHNWKNRMYSYAWPFLTWGIFTWIQISSGRWSLAFFSDTKNVGFLAVLLQIGYQPMQLLSAAASQMIAPILFEKAGDATKPSRLKETFLDNIRATFIALLLTFFGTAVGFFFHDQIFSILVNEEFHIVSSFLPWVILASGLFTAGQFLALIPLTAMKSKQLIGPKIVTSLMCVFFCGVGAKFFGLEGVVVAILLFSLTYVLWTAVLAVRIYRQIDSKVAASD